MKAFLLLVSIALVAAAPSYEDHFLEEWNHYKVRFNKTYDSEEEENYRMGIYKDSRRKIEEHNLRYEAGEVAYKMGINQFSDKVYEEVIKSHTGLLLQDEATSRSRACQPPEPSSNLTVPDSIDWVKMGAVTPVRNQGSCGSCYAFSALGALEGQYFIKKKQLVELSVQNIIDCSRPYGNFGCHGGWMVKVYEYVAATGGMNQEKTYPYEGKTGPCRFKPEDKTADCTGYIAVEKKEDKLKEAAAVGPVAVGVHVCLGFISYKEGIFTDTKCQGGLNHGVVLVGYGTDSKTKQDYWLLKNSWGTWWGEKGYMRIARNKGNICNILDYATYPIV